MLPWLHGSMLGSNDNEQNVDTHQIGMIWTLLFYNLQDYGWLYQPNPWKSGRIKY